MAALTRRELVLRLLQQHANEWVDGPAIASAEVGGSEGLKRLRELRQEGFDIRMRKHPDPRRDIFQYKLLLEVSPARSQTAAVASEVASRARDASGPEEDTTKPYNQADYEREFLTPADAGRRFPMKRLEDGSIEVVYQVCADCGGRYSVEKDHIRGEEHGRWLAASQTVGSQTAIPQVAQPPVYKYTEKPVSPKFGETLICPRCHGIRRKRKDGERDEMCMDPKNSKAFCQRCGGWGIVPNQGPVGGMS